MYYLFENSLCYEDLSNVCTFHYVIFLKPSLVNIHQSNQKSQYGEAVKFTVAETHFPNPNFHLKVQIYPLATNTISFFPLK